jgi:hypothetical protein
MSYRVTLRDVAVKDFRGLDTETQRQARRQLERLKERPSWERIWGTGWGWI